MPRNRTVPGIVASARFRGITALLQQERAVARPITNPVSIVAVPERAAPAGIRGGAAGAVPRPPELASVTRAEQEAVSKLRAHQIIEDRVNGGVQVHHRPAEIQDVVVPFRAQSVHGLLGNYDNPQDKHAEWY